MAVKIRLTRRGRKKRAMYDVIVADARSPRDGRLIEKLGTYNPLSNPATILIDEDKALAWLLKGAQPTDTARRILSHRGILLKKHLQVGVLKGAITQEQADKKFGEWIESKEAEISSTVDSIEKKKADVAKAKFEAEVKVNEAKAEALKKKLAALVPVEEVAVEAPVEEEAAKPAAEEAPAAKEPKAEKVPAEAPVKEAKEEVKAEAAPVAEEKAEEAKEEVKAEAAPVVEEKAEEAKEEVKAEAAPVVEEKVEEAKAEVKEEPKAEKEAPAKEEKKEDKK